MLEADKVYLCPPLKLLDCCQCLVDGRHVFKVSIRLCWDRVTQPTQYAIPMFGIMSCDSLYQSIEYKTIELNRTRGLLDTTYMIPSISAHRGAQ